MKIAIIGSGISSLSAAYYLKKRGHHITLFEANSYYGGHSNTVMVKDGKEEIPVDTGFLVHNTKTYPNLINLFEELDVAICETDMSLSVQIVKERIEWCSDNPFMQIKNIFSFKFLKMIYDILKFNRRGKRYLDELSSNQLISLGEFLKKEAFSKAFIEWYLVPMGAAIWSTPPEKMMDFPALAFIRFFENHGLSNTFNHIKWRTVKGGSKIYVAKIIERLDETYLNSPVESVRRENGRIQIVVSENSREFDLVVSGVHAPDNLKIVKDLSEEEKRILAKFSYQKNKAALHEDEEVLPRKRSAWSSWNYVLDNNQMNEDGVFVSYFINRLQPLNTARSMIVTLNSPKEIRADKLIKEIDYEHPVLDNDAYLGQKEILQIQGQQNLFYVGAWQRFGFHEDGIWSSLRAIDYMKEKLADI